MVFTLQLSCISIDANNHLILPGAYPAFEGLFLDFHSRLLVDKIQLQIVIVVSWLGPYVLSVHCLSQFDHLMEKIMKNQINLKTGPNLAAFQVLNKADEKKKLPRSEFVPLIPVPANPR